MAEIDTRFPAWMAQKNWATSDNVSRDLQTGYQLGQRNREMEIRREQENRQLLMQEAAQKLKTDMMRQQAEGQVALGIIMEQATQRNAWTDPQTRSKVYSLARQYPWLAETDLFKSTLQNFEHADMAQKQLDQILLRHTLEMSEPEPATADVKNINQLAGWKMEMREAIEAGDFDTAEGLKTQILQLEQQLAPSNQTIETFGPEGQLLNRITTGKGGATGTPELTTAVKSDLQKRIIGFEKANSMSKRLLETLGPLDVGLAGWGQQVVVNEGLAQFFPGLASQSTTDARALLGTFNETMIKTLKADSQVNQKEEQRILAVLPKPGPNESLPSATSKIIRAMREIHSMSSVDARKLGQPEPTFPLSAEEIKNLYKTGKLQDRALAEELLRTYYGFK